VTVAETIVVEIFKEFPQLGRFTLRDEGRTIAVGKVTSVKEFSKNNANSSSGTGAKEKKVEKEKEKGKGKEKSQENDEDEGENEGEDEVEEDANSAVGSWHDEANEMATRNGRTKSDKQ